MRVRFLIDLPGSIGGATEPYLAGEVYDVPDGVATTLLREAVAGPAPAVCEPTPVAMGDEAAHDADA